jgi:hypothetical protein
VDDARVIGFYFAVRSIYAGYKECGFLILTWAKKKFNTHVTGGVVNNVTRAIWIRGASIAPRTLGTRSKHDCDATRATITGVVVNHEKSQHIMFCGSAEFYIVNDLGSYLHSFENGSTMLNPQATPIPCYYYLQGDFIFF